MKNKNKYGFYSGAYITDLLDRAALKAINDKFNNADKQIYTIWAQVTFLNQLCNLKNVRTNAYDVHWVPEARTYVVDITLEQIDTVIATATFEFKQAFKNKCAIIN